jgi:hypothetical protein
MLPGWAEAHAECVTETFLAADKSFVEFRLNNACNGPAIVHRTRTYENKTEEGAWEVGACSAQDYYYGVGQYTFGEVEFRQGGADSKCLSKDDAAKRETDPDGSASTGRKNATVDTSPPAIGAVSTKWGCAARGAKGTWGVGGGEPTKESAIHGVLVVCGPTCRIVECRPNVNSDREALAIWPPPSAATTWCGPDYGTKC